MSSDGDAAKMGRTLKRPVPLRQSVYEALTDMIIDGSLQPGQHLVEVELASMLGVSRQPIREALQHLHNEGWVDLRPGFGAMVHVPAENEVDQLLTVRAAIEAESARLAARHSTPETVAKLREVCDSGVAHLEAGDIDGAVRDNAELHRLMTEMSGNKFLIQFSAQIDRRVRWYYTAVAEARGHASWQEHQQIVEAIANQDEALAAQIMRHHTEYTREAYLDNTTAPPPPGQRPGPEGATGSPGDPLRRQGA